jgi:hypothetical protein
LTKDNFLFAVIGLLLGFITGYLMHEVMAARQPARRMAVETAPAAAGMGAPPPAGAPSSAPPPPGGGGAGGPAMAEVRELTERVKNNPDDAEAVALLADMNFNIRNWPRAEELYNRYLELQPGDPDVMTNLSVCYRESGKLEQALDLVRQVQKVAPGHWPSVYNEVAVLLDLKRPAEAAEALVRLRRLQPGDPRVEQLAAEVERRKPA